MAYQGMRGTGSWGSNVLPQNWRQTILRLYPNGKAQLTAMLSMMNSLPTDSTTINWWTQTFLNQSAALSTSGVYKEAALSNKYVEGTDAQPAAGDIFYVSVPEAFALQCRVSHIISLEKAGDYRYRTRGRIVHVDVNGATSSVGFRLLEASDGTYDIDEVDRAMLLAGSSAQGAERPNAIAQDPVQYWNNTQIMRTPLSITNTNRAERSRIGNLYENLKLDALDYHGAEIERAVLYGVRSSTTGSNGKPQTTMDGIVTILKRDDDSNSNGNVEAFSHAAPYTTSDWLATTQTGSTSIPNGMAWLDKKLEVIMRYGEPNKVGFCGSGALLGIQQLAQVAGHINITPVTTEFGIQVMRWITPFGTIDLRTHPLMTQDPQLRNDLLILEPRSIIWRPLVNNGINRDTHFVPAGEQSNNNGKDATEEEFLTEATIEVHHPLKHGYLTRVGLDYDEAIESS